MSKFNTRERNTKSRRDHGTNGIFSGGSVCSVISVCFVISLSFISHSPRLSVETPFPTRLRSLSSLEINDVAPEYSFPHRTSGRPSPARRRPAFASTRARLTVRQWRRSTRARPFAAPAGHSRRSQSILEFLKCLWKPQVAPRPSLRRVRWESRHDHHSRLSDMAERKAWPVEGHHAILPA